MIVAGMTLTDELRSQGHHLPGGHELTTLAERPDQHHAVERFGSSVWPEFMLKDAVSERLWPRLAPGPQRLGHPRPRLSRSRRDGARRVSRPDWPPA